MRKYGYILFFGVILLVFFISSCQMLTGQPPIVDIVSPEDGATNVSLKPELIWEMSDPDEDTLSVKVYLSSDKAEVENESATPIFEGEDATSCTVEDLLEYDTTYYW
ncbi:MAG: hypothetical protein J7L34_08255, partial [Thermotogaceae bacterium]|nr:hypothetical protein [Thermotogaceae bacterium]